MRVKVLRSGMLMASAYYALLEMIMRYRLIAIIIQMKILKCLINYHTFLYTCITIRDTNNL